MSDLKRTPSHCYISSNIWNSDEHRAEKIDGISRPPIQAINERFCNSCETAKIFDDDRSRKADNGSEQQPACSSRSDGATPCLPSRLAIQRTCCPALGRYRSRDWTNIRAPLERRFADCASNRR